MVEMVMVCFRRVVSPLSGDSGVVRMWFCGDIGGDGKNVLYCGLVVMVGG